MASLNDLINQQLEMNKQTYSPKLVGMDGVEISEDNVTIDIVNKYSDNANERMVEVERTFDTLETVNELKDVLVELQNIGASDASQMSLAKTIQRLSGVEETEEIALESYIKPMYLVERTISQEGFIDVVKAIFRKIKELVVGFFKAIWNFLKSLVVFEKSVDDVKKSNDKRIENIKKDKLKLPEDAKNVSTHLHRAVGMAGNDVNVTELVTVTKAMYERVKSTVNDHSIEAIKLVNDGILVGIRTLLDTLKNEEVTKNNISKVVANINSILEGVINVRTKLLNHPTDMSKTPNEIYEKLMPSSGSAGGYEITSLIQDSDEKSMLPYGFNVYGVYNSHIKNVDGIADLTDEDIIFGFTNFSFASELKKTTDTIPPIGDIDELEALHKKSEEMKKGIKFDELDKLFKKASDNASSILSYMEGKGCIDVTKLKHFTTTGASNIDQFRAACDLFVAEPVKLNSFLNSVGSEGKSNYVISKLKYCKTAMDALIANNTSITPSLFEPLINESQSKTVDLIEAVELLRKYNMVREDDLAATVTPLTESERELYRKVDVVLDKILKAGLTSFSKLMADVSSELRKNYSMFDGEVTRYIRLSAEQYK